MRILDQREKGLPRIDCQPEQPRKLAIAFPAQRDQQLQTDRTVGFPAEIAPRDFIGAAQELRLGWIDRLHG